jgi:hypothetical protein
VHAVGGAAQFADGLVEALGVSGEENHPVRAGFQKEAGGIEANTATGSGDDDGFE